MWPWGHVAVAYLVYSALVRRRYQRLPNSIPAFAVVVGSQFPDLIDKPLSWSLGVLPGGRTLAHSVFFAALLFPVLVAVATRYNRTEVGVAFCLGHLAHLLTDLGPSFFTGEFGAATYLFWPVLDQPDYAEPDSLLEGFLRYSMGGYEWFQLGLFALAVVVWYYDGRPGLAYIRLQLGRLVSLNE